MTKNPTNANAPDFLPLTRAEIERLGWDQLDVLLVTGDAYVDHPSFAVALLGRWLAARGFRVGIAAQPRWDSPAEVMALGRPRLFAGVAAGALDSMLAHYTAFRKKRHDDEYTPGGAAGARPNRASIVYTSLVKHAFPGLPVVIGGIEASLRRASHYDFWSDKLRRSILLESKADLLVYGMGERQILEIAERLQKLFSASEKFSLPEIKAALMGIAGTVFAARPEAFSFPPAAPVITLPAHEEILADPKNLMTATLSLERQVHQGETWAEQFSGDRRVVMAPPAAPLSTAEMDALYALPFTRRAHPSYQKPVPALEMIQFSITSHRGCGGGCSFCALAQHQGRIVSSRSRDSILLEADRLAAHPDFKGGISDVGGPTANFWGAVCGGDPATCRRSSCLHPHICPQLQDRQSDLADLLEALSRRPVVRSVRVASGVRHDLALKNEKYLRALVRNFVGGQLKLAPEHSSERVLSLMRKPSFAAFTEFLERFDQYSRAAGKEQYVVPYLISAAPGCTEADMRELAGWLTARGWKPRQVQCFIPTPGTVAAAMYYAGIDEKGRPLPIARTDAERLRQHHMLIDGQESKKLRR